MLAGANIRFPESAGVPVSCGSASSGAQAEFVPVQLNLFAQQIAAVMV